VLFSEQNNFSTWKEAKGNGKQATGNRQ